LVVCARGSTLTGFEHNNSQRSAKLETELASAAPWAVVKLGHWPSYAPAAHAVK
jgi:hypothetical protein